MGSRRDHGVGCIIECPTGSNKSGRSGQPSRTGTWTSLSETRNRVSERRGHLLCRSARGACEKLGISGRDLPAPWGQLESAESLCWRSKLLNL
jgi:hypothetical protein